MLVNLPQDSHLCIPSKVYEYMRYAAWLLALEPADSATALLLRDSAADVVGSDQDCGIGLDQFLSFLGILDQTH